MIKKRKIYALMFPLALVAAVTACGKQEIILAGDGGKTSLEFAVAVKEAVNELPETKAAREEAAQTKAVDNKFENGDKLYTYIQHVGPDSYVGFERLCDIDVHTTSVGPITNWTSIGSTTQLVANNMYWDDFMDSSNDIRATGHGLQSKYAFCFNGGTPVPDIRKSAGADDAETAVINTAKAAGEITWTVAADQSATNGFKHSDLLMSKTQDAVTYNHSYSSALDGKHGVINLPFTHAMSKVTIEIVAGETFSGSNIFNETVVTLKNVNSSCLVTAPTQSLSGYAATGGDVKMLKATSGTAKKRSFTAVMAPTVIRGGADAANAIEFATLQNVGGYNYSLKLTRAAIETAPAGAAHSWKDKLTNHDASSVSPASYCGEGYYTSENGGLSLPGVNYFITVTVERTGIEVSATIANWETVSGEAVGQIQFDEDISTTGSIDDALKTGGFDVYARSKQATEYGSYASRVTWNEQAEGGANWVYEPQLYWPSGTYESYFRALAPAGSGLALTAGDYIHAADILWGTTAKEDYEESGIHYAEGAAIKPRTGKVPLQFYHAMAKISFNLSDAHENDPAGHGHGADSHLDLRGAKISLHNLAAQGTLNLHTGVVEKGEDVETLISGYYAANDGSVPQDAKKLKDYLVIPQSILNGHGSINTPYAQITLADGTKYRLDLRNTVKETESGSLEIFNDWKKGTEYVYNVYLSKEAITFRALVKAWDRYEGSGNATLEWD